MSFLSPVTYETSLDVLELKFPSVFQKQIHSGVPPAYGEIKKVCFPLYFRSEQRLDTLDKHIKGLPANVPAHHSITFVRGLLERFSFLSLQPFDRSSHCSDTSSPTPSR